MKIKTTTDLYNIQKKLLTDYRLIQLSIRTREEDDEVKAYLEELAYLKEKEAELAFYDSLEIGKDGTIFESAFKISRAKDDITSDLIIKHPKRPIYIMDNLEEFINYAFSVKYYSNEYQESQPMTLAFGDLLAYNNMVTKVLQEMIAYPDEEPISTPYNQKVYKNPKNIFTFIDSEILSKCIFEPEMFSLKLEISSCEMKEIEVQNKTLTYRNSSEFEPMDTTYLSMREKNALFGEEVQKILGVTIDDALFTKPQEDGTIKKSPYTK